VNTNTKQYHPIYAARIEKLEVERRFYFERAKLQRQAYEYMCAPAVANCFSTAEKEAMAKHNGINVDLAARAHEELEIVLAEHEKLTNATVTIDFISTTRSQFFDDFAEIFDSDGDGEENILNNKDTGGESLLSYFDPVNIRCREELERAGVIMDYMDATQ
jgi:hypothetical protein